MHDDETSAGGVDVTPVLINPSAGPARDSKALIEALRRLSPVEMLETHGPGDAVRLARAAVEAGARRLVVAGGDGTLHEAINGIVEAGGEVDVCLVPVGTGNDLARTLGVPTEPAEAVALLREGEPQPIDVVRVDAGSEVRYAINAITGGFSGVVSERNTERGKGWMGALSYVVSASRALTDLERYQVELRIDGGEPIQGCLLNFVLSSGRFVGGGVEVAPAAHPDDGLLDLMLVPCLTAAELAVVGPAIALGRHGDDERLDLRRVRCLEIDAAPPMPITVDGELGLSSPVRCEVLPRAVRLLRPRAAVASP